MPRLEFAVLLPYLDDCMYLKLREKATASGRTLTLDTRRTDLARKKERSGLQSACDELIDKGAFITGE